MRIVKCIALMVIVSAVSRVAWGGGAIAAFGFTDASGGRIISIGEEQPSDPAALTKAICFCGKIFTVQFLRHQNEAEKSTGRQNAANFKDIGGDLYRLTDGKAKPDTTCLVVGDGFLSSGPLLVIKPIKGALDRTSAAKVEAAKQRKIARSWGLIEAGEFQFFLVLFERQGKNALASIAVIGRDRQIFSDYSAEFNETSTWKADDGGNIGPEQFDILFVQNAGGKITFGVVFRGFEGENVDMMLEDKGMFTSALKGYRSRAPM